MKSEYGKKDYQKGYQATSNKLDKQNRNPNAPTQGGFSTPGGGTGNKQQKNPQQQQYNKTQTNTNTWGKQPISGDKNKDRG